MTFDRPIVSLDIESTGPDPCDDAIFELGMVLHQPDGTRKPWAQGFKPWKPISLGASEVTGRKTEEFDGCPTFAEWAPKILRAISGKDLCGYNLKRFDLVILDQELRRAGLKLDLTGVRVIDAQAIFFKREERSLAAAVQRYCGREHTGAHGARADAEATLDVLFGQFEAYPDLAAMPLDQLAEYCQMADHPPVDLAGKLYRDTEGFVCYGFGKSKDKRIADDLGYANWMISRSNFPGSTIDAVCAELDRLGH